MEEVAAAVIAVLDSINENDTTDAVAIAALSVLESAVPSASDEEDFSFCDDDCAFCGDCNDETDL